MQAIKAIEDAAVKSAEVAMEQVRTDLVSAQTMPFDTGDMQDNQTFVHADESGASLVTGSPQARRLYYHPEYHFQNYRLVLFVKQAVRTSLFNARTHSHISDKILSVSNHVCIAFYYRAYQFTGILNGRLSFIVLILKVSLSFGKI